MPASSKWKLKMVNWLNGEEFSTHLTAVKIDGETIQDAKTLNRHASILFFIATNGLAVLPDFDSLDDSFSHHKELVPKTTQPSCLQFNMQFKHIDKLLSNQPGSHVPGNIREHVPQIWGMFGEQFSFPMFPKCVWGIGFPHVPETCVGSRNTVPMFPKCNLGNILGNMRAPNFR